MNRDRGQTSLVGVALLLAITVVSLGVLTAAAGTAVERGADAVAADRVADDLTRVADGGGTDRLRVSVIGGDLRAVDRTVRVLDGDGEPVASVDVDGLVYENGRRRVATVAGGVVDGDGDDAHFRSSPQTTAAGDALLLSVTALDVVGFEGYGGSGTRRVGFRVNATGERRGLGTGEYAVAVETRTPAPWRRHLGRTGATVETRDVDGDGVPSAVGRYPGERRAVLVVRGLRMEVARG